MTKNYTYVYRIKLQRFDEDPLWYIGIRSCECLPEEDDYVGTPTVHRRFWNDSTYTKTKEILCWGTYEYDYDYLMRQEVKEIRECWNDHGLYELGGRCLNVNIAMLNQKKGIAKAKAKGVYKGRKATIDARDVMSLKDSGLGASAIAKRLGIGRASVYRALKK